MRMRAIVKSGLGTIRVRNALLLIVNSLSLSLSLSLRVEAVYACAGCNLQEDLFPHGQRRRRGHPVCGLLGELGESADHFAVCLCAQWVVLGGLVLLGL